MDLPQKKVQCPLDPIIVESLPQIDPKLAQGEFKEAELNKKKKQQCQQKMTQQQTSTQNKFLMFENGHQINMT